VVPIPVPEVASPLPADFHDAPRQATKTLSRKDTVPEPWAKQPSVLNACQSFATRFVPGSDPFALYTNGCHLSEFMGFCLFLKTVHLP